MDGRRAKDYDAKPRPAVILQDDRFDATESVTICVMTTDPTEAPLFRVPISPNERNGLILFRASWLMRSPQYQKISSDPASGSWMPNI